MPATFRRALGSPSPLPRFLSRLLRAAGFCSSAGRPSLRAVCRRYERPRSCELRHWVSCVCACVELSLRSALHPVAPPKAALHGALFLLYWAAPLVLCRTQAPGPGRPPGGLPSGVWYTPAAAPLPAGAGEEARGPLGSGSPSTYDVTGRDRALGSPKMWQSGDLLI